MQVYDFELLAVVKVRNCFCGLRRLRLFSDSAFLELDEVRGSEHVFLERDVIHFRYLRFELGVDWPILYHEIDLIRQEISYQFLCGLPVLSFH